MVFAGGAGCLNMFFALSARRPIIVFISVVLAENFNYNQHQGSGVMKELIRRILKRWNRFDIIEYFKL